MRQKLKESVLNGIQKGWSGFVWILKILVPISFLTALLEFSGWIYWLNHLLEPAMRFLYLPPAAAMPLISGLLTGVYAGIASMAVLPLTSDQMTLIAIFLLIAHNLIQEGIIQSKSGTTFLVASLSRLGMAVLAVLVAAQFLGSNTSQAAQFDAKITASMTVVEGFKAWFLSISALSLKMFFIIIGVMVLLELMKTFQLTQPILKVFNPVLRLMGLSRRVGMMWLTAVLFGVAYGGAVIVEEARNGKFSREEIEKLHLSIGSNHAMIEDPLLFMALGLNPLWMLIPRFLAAVFIVYLAAAWFKVWPALIQLGRLISNGSGKS